MESSFQLKNYQLHDLSNCINMESSVQLKVYQLHDLSNYVKMESSFQLKVFTIFPRSCQLPFSTSCRPQKPTPKVKRTPGAILLLMENNNPGENKIATL